MKKKNYGWALQCKNTGLFLTRGLIPTPFRWACVFSSREDARNTALPCDTVRKVSLSRAGRPKAVIGRG